MDFEEEVLGVLVSCLGCRGLTFPGSGINELNSRFRV